MNESHDEKKYGVAAIIDERTIIINYGKEDGAKAGQNIKVLSNHTLHLNDPFTGDDLGKLRHIKAEVQIARVEQKYSFCSSKKKMNFGIGLGDLTYSKNLNSVLRVNTKFLSREITEEPIDVGDLIEIENT